MVVTCPAKSFLHESWRQQAWAAARSSEVHDELMADLTRQEARTIWTCAAFALLGVVVMACIALAVTQPLKRISLDMLSMAKLEFLPDRHLPPGSSQNLHIRNRRNSTSFISIAGFGRLMSNLTGSTRSRVCSDSDTSGSSSSSSDSEVSENEKELELDLSERGCCWEHAIPREVVRMRESFLYMVTGLKSFARYMDPEIMRILVKSRRQAQLGMGKAQVTVFFSDIANFTTMAESLEPETFMSMLSEYLDEMSKIIMAKRGVVGEFIGDAIMAWWNVPIDLGQEHTAMALDAALSQQNRLRDLRDMWQARGLPDVRVRMGLVRGTVLAGNIGSSQRMKYGLVGDSVNLASRLEGLCKYYGVSIIVEQDAAFAPAVQNRFLLRLLDLVTVKGRTQATELYELVAEKGDFPEEIYSEEDLQYFLVGFAEIHRLFRSKSFGACAEALRLYRQQFPHDTPSKMLLRRVETLLAEGMPADWNPVHRLTEK